MEFDRELSKFCDSRIGRAINVTSMWGIVFGALASGTIGIALLFGRASVTHLGVAITLTGCAIFTHTLTE